jgi:hypothetical protein
MGQEEDGLIFSENPNSWLIRNQQPPPQRLMSVNDGFDTPRRRSLRDCGLDTFTPRGCKTRASLDAGDPGPPARVFPLRKWNRVDETGLVTVSAFPSATGDRAEDGGPGTGDR